MNSMRPIKVQCRSGVAMILVASLALASHAAVSRAATADWPRRFDSSSGTFVIYQPQPETLVGDVVAARAAFSLQKKAGATPVFGVLWFTETIAIDRDSSTVEARNLDVTKVRMPDITTLDAAHYEKLVEAEAVHWDLSGSLAELQAGLASSASERASVEDLDNTPPPIVFAYEPTVLVMIDGPPMLEPIEGTGLETVVNTPYAIVRDPDSGVCYLGGANLWYRADDPLGPWTSVGDPPAPVRAAVPPDTAARDQYDGPPPRVMTVTEPTELIVIDGEPLYTPLVGGDLLYIANTESDVVREVSTQRLFVLIAGRWFRASSDQGPWTYVSGDSLPASFRRIPPDSPKGHLLASVAGTEQADDALADAEIPQTSAIRRDLTGFEVHYDGEPMFAPIEGTNMLYAINSDVDVIFADGRYFACDQGVWYVSDDAEGPWAVSEVRPVDIDSIPPSCPVYDTRYVVIYDYTPDVIYVGYTPGYTGCYPYHGTVVYGTGYRYRPWRGHHRYYSRPWTWGFHPRYNPYLSRWSFGFSSWSGFLHVGFRWHSTRLSAHQTTVPLWFGPGGYRRPLLDANRSMRRVRLHRRAYAGGDDRLPMNLYNRSRNVGRVDLDANRVPPRQYKRPGAPARRVQNNVFAGRDGRVYLRDPQGNWKVREGPKWKPTSEPVETPVVEKPAARIAPRERRGVGQIAPEPTREPARAAAPPDRPTSSPSAPPPTVTRDRPAAPSPQPAPRPAPVAPPRVEPRPQPAPPQISPSPGNLEREFRGRQRANDAPKVEPAPTSRPAPQPARPEKETAPKQEKQKQKEPEKQKEQERPKKKS